MSEATTGAEHEAPAPAPAPPAQRPLPEFADGRPRAFADGAVSVESIVLWIVAGVVAGCGAVALAVVWIVVRPGGLGLWLPLAGWACVSVLLGLLALLWPAAAHRHRAFVVDGLGVELREGVVWRRIVTVPRSRIQHIDVVQGPLLRRYGVAVLTVHTAGTQQPSVIFPGLEHGLALRLRDHLIGSDDADGV